jgi:hypothetical protein
LLPVAAGLSRDSNEVEETTSVAEADGEQAGRQLGRHSEQCSERPK